MAESAKAGPPTPRRRLASFLEAPPRLAVLAVCAAVLCLRRAEAVTNPQFWAEDSYFFVGAYVMGWHAFAIPHAGYLHSVLRAIAEIAVTVDSAHAPGIFVGCSAAVTLYVAGLALSKRCPLPPLGGLCALAVVLVPDTYEIFLNLVNLQWVIGAGLVLVLISRDPRSGWQWIHDLAASAAMGLTGPFCIIFLPLFVWRAWSRRTRASVALAAVTLVCAVIQGCMLHRQPAVGDGAPGAPIAFQLFLPAIGRRIGGSILMGSLLSGETDQYVGTIVGIATLAGIGFLSFRRGPLRSERSLLGLAFFALVTSALYRTRHSLDQYFSPLAHARYVFIPQLIALWLLLSTVGQKGVAGKIAPALCAWALLVNIPRYREPAYADMHWSRYESRIRAGEAVVVPINPRGWIMPLPARR